MAAEEIKIGNTTVKMLATGATPIFYKDFFHEDLIAMLNSNMTNDGNIIIAIEQLTQVGFVMAMQGEGKGYDDMSALTRKEFVEWTDKFSFTDLLQAGPEIMQVLNNNQKSEVDLKKTTIKE